MIVLTAVTLLATFDAVFASSCLSYNVNESPNTLRYMRHEPLTAPVTHGCILACQALENCTAVAVWNQTSGEGRNCSLLIVESGDSVEYGDGSAVGADPNAELMTKPGGPVAPPPPCPTGFELLENTCVHFTTDSTYSGDTAKTYCEGLANGAGRAITINNTASAAAIVSKLPAGVALLSVGTRKNGAGQFAHLHPPHYTIPIGHDLWNSGSPDEVLPGKDCVFLLQSNGKLRDAACTQASFAAGCETDRIN